MGMTSFVITPEKIPAGAKTRRIACTQGGKPHTLRIATEDNGRSQRYHVRLKGETWRMGWHGEAPSNEEVDRRFHATTRAYFRELDRRRAR